jgi:hypothetical protein
MSFNVLFAHVLNVHNDFQKVVKVLSRTEEGKDTTYWIDFRSVFNNGETIKHLKDGVCLKPIELDKLLPKMIATKEFELNDGIRNITFKCNEKFNYLYDIKMVTMDGKESSIRLTLKEIKQIYFIRKSIFESCSYKSETCTIT